MMDNVEFESRRSAGLVRAAIDAVRAALPETAAKFADEFVDFDEYELGLETIVDCLSEIGTTISKEQYDSIAAAAQRLDLENILAGLKVR